MRSVRHAGFVSGLRVLGWLCVASATLLCLPGPAVSQPGVFPGGGGSSGTAGQPAVVATIGQAIGGGAGGAGTPTVHAGFMSALAAGSATGAILPASVNAGSAATIRVALSGFDPAPTATLRYRMGGDAVFTNIVMTPPNGGSNEWVATLPSAVATMRGIQFYVTATNGIASLTLPPGAPAAALADLGVVLTSQPIFSLAAQTFELRGIPMAATNPEATAVFDELGSYDVRQWRYGTLAPGTRTYLEPPEAAAATPGQGFWIISRAAHSIAATGRSTPLDQSVSIPLQVGFNQIACPYGFAVPFNSSGVTLPAGTDNNLIGWNGTAYENGQTTLQPGRGYWIYFGGTPGAALTIHPVGVVTKNAANEPVLAKSADDESGWAVSVSAQAGAFWDTENRFGQRERATAARDADDFMDAPPPPEGHVTISLVSPQGERLLNDFRAIGRDGESWALALDTDQANTPFRLAFTVERPLPESWRLLAIDTATLDEVDLLSAGEIRGRAGPTGATRLWRLAAGPEAFVGRVRDEVVEEINQTIVAFALKPASPNPFQSGSGTVITLASPQAAAATLRIYDLRGRVVKTLHSGEVSRGLQRFPWYGRDDANQGVAAGIYLVRLRAPGTDVVQKIMLLR